MPMAANSMRHSYRLFKYRSLSGDGRGFTEGIITSRRIYYAAPEELNDPFDCHFCVNMDSASLSPLALSCCNEVKTRFEEELLERVNSFCC